MGCDGGTIPKRKEIVKNKQRQPRREETEQQAAERWKQCAISNWRLIEPIVANHYGHLMSKEAVLEHYIEWKQDLLSAHQRLADKGDVLSTIHSMKDIKGLKLTKNQLPEGECGPSTSREPVLRGDYVCPITGLETNGKHKFVFSWNCGCVMAERAIKEVKDEDKCLVCQTPYTKIDLVKINPTISELAENQAKFAARKMRSMIARHNVQASSSKSSVEKNGTISGPSTSRKRKSRSDRPSESRSKQRTT